MHKDAVGYAIGKLMQILGFILTAPLAIALWDYRELPFSDILARPRCFRV